MHMHKRNVWAYICGVVLFLVPIIVVGSASAQTAVSPNYQITESEFNAGSMINSCSGQYCARASIGSLAVGGSEGEAYATEFGPITPEEPVIEVIVDPGESNLGMLETTKTATKTTIVRVRTYLSDGYVLQITGDPPKYGNYKLATPSTPTASIMGTEQFAINVAPNTAPAVGAAPLQVPAGQVVFGEVSDDYNTPNLFKYSSGDVVAHSSSKSGRTDYTISMIVNISNLTPAGNYSGDFAAVVVPMY